MRALAGFVRFAEAVNDVVGRTVAYLTLAMSAFVMGSLSASLPFVRNDLMLSLSRAGHLRVRQKSKRFVRVGLGWRTVSFLRKQSEQIVSLFLAERSGSGGRRMALWIQQRIFEDATHCWRDQRDPDER